MIALGGIIALQPAIDAPNLMHSLALWEASLPMVPNGKERLDGLFLPVMIGYRSGNKQAAGEIFGDARYGSNCQPIVEQIIPGGGEQAVKDADVTFQELPIKLHMSQKR